MQNECVARSKLERQFVRISTYESSELILQSIESSLLGLGQITKVAGLNAGRCILEEGSFVSHLREKRKTT